MCFGAQMYCRTQPQYHFTITGTNKNGQEMFSTKFKNETNARSLASSQYAGEELMDNTNHQANDVFIMNLEVRYRMFKDPNLDQNIVNDEILKIAEKNLAMLNDSKYSDFTFAVKRRSFKVHKAILGAASPVFDRMFSTAMAEAQTNEAKIDAIEPDIFEHLLRFIYGGKLPENLAAVAVDLFKAAHYYEIENLKKICGEEIEEKLSVGNAIQFYELAYVYDMKELKADAWKIIKR
jgi:hypothetical protein